MNLLEAESARDIISRLYRQRPEPKGAFVRFVGGAPLPEQTVMLPVTWENTPVGHFPTVRYSEARRPDNWNAEHWSYALEIIDFFLAERDTSGSHEYAPDLDWDEAALEELKREDPTHLSLTPSFKWNFVGGAAEFDRQERLAFNAEEGIEESHRLSTLKKHRVKLTPQERSEVIRRGATWDDGSPGVWKAIVNGEAYYACNTHRACQIKPTLKGAIRAFKFIKTTA